MAGKAINMMYQRQKGANLEGLDEKSIAMYNTYQALRRGLPPQEAAQEAYNSVYNQKPEERKIVEDNWTEQIKTIKTDVGKLKYFTNIGGIDASNLVDPLGYVEQAESIMRSNYILTKGNLDAAKQMTSDTIKNTYAESNVNGRPETVFYPIEKAIGIPSDGAGYIQDDIIEHVNTALKSGKEAFDKGDNLYYWEVEPRLKTQESNKNDLLHSQDLVTKHLMKPFTGVKELSDNEAGSPIKIFKHWKNGTRETYSLIVKADPWLAKTANPNKPYTAGWDIVVSKGTGYQPLFRENPLLGTSIIYQPDIKSIKSKYLQAKGLTE